MTTESRAAFHACQSALMALQQAKSHLGKIPEKECAVEAIEQMIQDLISVNNDIIEPYMDEANRIATRISTPRIAHIDEVLVRNEDHA